MYVIHHVQFACFKRPKYLKIETGYREIENAFGKRLFGKCKFSVTFIIKIAWKDDFSSQWHSSGRQR